MQTKTAKRKMAKQTINVDRMPRMKRLSYQTKNLIIRPLALTDYQRWFDSHDLSKPQLDKFDAKPWPRKKRTKAVFKQAVLRQRKLAKDDKAYLWNLFLRSTGEMVGHMDVSPLCRDSYQMANLGYFIINSYRGKGYAQEALRVLIPAAFRDLKLHRLEAAIDADNKASLRLARAAGLHYEGVKKHYWFQNGRWEDQKIFVSSPELWRKRKR